MLLTRLTVVIVLWYTQNHYAVHLKLTQCYMAVIPQVNSVHQEETWIFSLKSNQKNCLPEIIYWFFFFFFWQGPVACGILVPRPGIEPVPLHWNLSLNHWTAREIPIYWFWESNPGFPFALLCVDEKRTVIILNWSVTWLEKD